LANWLHQFSDWYLSVLADGGYWLIAGLMAYTSWRGSFVALGLSGLVWVALWWWVFRDDPRKHESITADELTRLPPPPSTSQALTRESIFT